MKRILFYFPVLICLLFSTSCDTAPEGGNAKSFGTVYLWAEYPTTVYEADIQVRTDADGDGTCDGTSVFPDDVSIKVESTAHESLPDDIAESSVKIQQALIEFIPQNTTSPAVPSKVHYIDVVVEPDGSVDVPIRVIDRRDKISGDHPFSTLTDVEYFYTVRISLSTEEIDTEITKTIEGYFSLRYTDLDTDDCT